jgi:oxaloacetate decarboxylase beta subunit
MDYASKKISKRTKIIFPLATLIIVSVLVPAASPLISVMMFGNLLRESGVVDRLAKTAQNDLMNIVIILLGLSVGATMPANVFLKLETI